MAGCKKSADDTPAPVVNVQAEKPEVGEIAEHIFADATLAPLAQAAISPKITAPVKAFYVQRGAHVNAGQLLAELENRDLAGQALDNHGQLMAAQASYDLQAKGTAPEEMKKAEDDVAQSKAQYMFQISVVEQRRKLFQQGAIAGRDLDTAVAQLAQAKATYDNAVHHLAALRNVGNRATVQQAQGNLTSARGKYDASAAQVSYSRIRSPISGVVTDRPLFPGETAVTGTPMITVMDTSALLAKVHLAQVVAQRLHLGDPATVAIPGVDTPVPAKVTLISPALDPGSTTVEVWLRVENKNGAFKGGTPVRCSIEGRVVPQAIKISVKAVLTAEDGTKSVMVMQSDGTAKKVPVKLGITDGDDVQVTDGITVNQAVITDGAYGLSDGTKVKVGADDEKEGEKP